MKFVIVGNGIAGLSAAHAIRSIDRKGSITIVSDDAGPAYSACVLSRYLEGEIPRDRVIIASLSDYSRDGIELLPSRKVTGLDHEKRRVILDSESLLYDRLIIAAGSAPIIPPSIPPDRDGLFTFKSLSDADKIMSWKGERAVVVGSGPIGLEAAIALKRRGWRSTVIEAFPHILPKLFDEYPANLIRKRLENEGIEVIEGECLVTIPGNGRISGIATDRRTLACDMVVLATGMRPRGSWTSGKIRRGERGGIEVNTRMETDLADVYGCGDCVEARDVITGQRTSSMLWHNARQQGETAGRNAAGVPTEYRGSFNVTGLDLFDMQALSIGISGSEGTDGCRVIEREREGGYQRVIFRDSEVVGVQAIDWPEDVGQMLASILRREKATGLADLLGRRKQALRTVRPFGAVAGRHAAGSRQAIKK